ncbi:MAG: hypothetical protein LUD72_02065 [Bacteroidales bacterium]|nr:hypothetical protein [Bacteroidales bacterium]
MTTTKCERDCTYCNGDQCDSRTELCAGCGAKVRTDTAWTWAGEKLCPRCYWIMRVQEEGR